jgi:hypothetical protein
MPNPEAKLTLLQTLDAVCYALNVIPNTRLLACPHDIKNTYALVKLVEEHKRWAEENKEDADL